MKPLSLLFLHISLPLKRRTFKLITGLSSFLCITGGEKEESFGDCVYLLLRYPGFALFSEISYNQEASPWVEEYLFLWLPIIFLTQHETKKMVRSCSSSDACFLWGFFWPHCMACRILSKDQTCARCSGRADS